MVCGMVVRLIVRAPEYVTLPGMRPHHRRYRSVLSVLSALLLAVGLLSMPAPAAAANVAVAPSVATVTAETNGVLDAGGSHSCAVRPSGSLTCWGNDLAGNSTPPTGPFISVAVGSSHTC